MAVFCAIIVEYFQFITIFIANLCPKTHKQITLNLYNDLEILQTYFKDFRKFANTDDFKEELKEVFKSNYEKL